jgi:hypothetical protein
MGCPLLHQHRVQVLGNTQVNAAVKAVEENKTARRRFKRCDQLVLYVDMPYRRFKKNI